MLSATQSTLQRSLRCRNLSRVGPFPRSLSTEAPTSSSGSPRRLRKYARRTAYLGLGLGAVLLADKEFNASAIGRNLRTLYTCAAISIDYKLNFKPEKADQIPLLHERVAQRMYDLFTLNGGLYIKMGQAIGANAPLMPRPMQDKFGRLFDDAPQIPYESVLAVFKKEFGRPPAGPDGLFEEFEEQAMASASVAQVHKAKTKDGRWVAVKIQKPDVSRQINYDLTAFKAVMWMFEHWVFDLPVYFVADFITDHLKQELDFVQEATNSRTMAAFVAAEPRLAQQVHIPKVYPEYSSKRIMTAEWIDGVRLSNRASIRKLMGERDKDAQAAQLPPHLEGVRLQGGVRAVMQSMVELFSAQMFSWGWVHCDPHPGNIIIRPHPERPGKPQLVLLDHGLYVRVQEPFRRQYATLWRGLLAADFKAIEGVITQWGFGAPDLFASATLMRPIKLRGQKPRKGGVPMAELNQYDHGVMMKARLKEFLTDTDKMPKELIFLGRNMRIVQGNNQALGSPVNRIKITGYWASRSLVTMPSLTLSERIREYWHYFIFQTVMLSIDTAFWLSKLNEMTRRFLGLKTESFEDELERSMRGYAKTHMGVDVAPDAFNG